MEKFYTEKVMDELDIFQPRFGKIDKFGWWDLKRISSDAGTKVTLTDIKEEFQTRRVQLTLASTEHREMNRQVEITWRTSRTITHSLMVHAKFLEAYIHFVLMYTTDHMFPVIPIIDMINKDSKMTTPFKLAAGKNLHYCIYACYFVHVLYGNLLHTLTKRY